MAGSMLSSERKKRTNKGSYELPDKIGSSKGGTPQYEGGFDMQTAVFTNAHNLKTNMQYAVRSGQRQMSLQDWLSMMIRVNEKAEPLHYPEFRKLMEETK